MVHDQDHFRNTTDGTSMPLLGLHGLKLLHGQSMVGSLALPCPVLEIARLARALIAVLLPLARRLGSDPT